VTRPQAVLALQFPLSNVPRAVCPNRVSIATRGGVGSPSASPCCLKRPLSRPINAWSPIRPSRRTLESESRGLRSWTGICYTEPLMHRSRSIKLLVCLALGLWLNGIAWAQRSTIPQDREQARKRIRAQRISTPPVMDGLVREPVWRQIEPANGFIQQEPNEGSVATEQTEVRFGYDNRNVYIGIICFDSQPENIIVTQNRRDGSLTDTDSIQILLDTFHDGQNAFIFGTSPTGIEYDGQV